MNSSSIESRYNSSPTLVRGVDVEVKTIFALVFGEELLKLHEVIPPRPRHELERLRLVGQLGWEPLRAGRAVPIRHTRPWPGLRIPCGAEPVDPDGRSGVRDAQEDLHGAERAGHGEHKALDEAVTGLDTRPGRCLPRGKGQSFREEHEEC